MLYTKEKEDENEPNQTKPNQIMLLRKIVNTHARVVLIEYVVHWGVSVALLLLLDHLSRDVSGLLRYRNTNEGTNRRKRPYSSYREAS